MTIVSPPALDEAKQALSYSALDLAAQIQAGSVTATAMVAASLAHIAAHDTQVGAFTACLQEQALATAAEVDKKAAAGQTLPLLAGVPLALKDNINLAGTETTCSSKILKGYISPFTATAIERVLANGIPIVGKTNLDEFAMGSSTENSAVQATRNPWDLTRVPGGSSGGSAAAVAAGMTPLSLGSDTGGSVRQPAALCGLVGVKPTYGLVSRYGLVAFGSSLDQISPFARTVRDAAALLQVTAGPDPMDSTGLHDTVIPDYLAAIDAQAPKGLAGVRVGLIRELNGEGMQADVQEALAKTQALLTSLGASITEITLPSIAHAVPVYYIVATAEASSNLGRFDGVRYGLRVADNDTTLHQMYRKTRAEGFGPEVKRRIMLGTFCLSAGYVDAFYGKANQVRALMAHEFNQAFTQVDVLVCPTSPTTAFELGAKANDPVAMYLSDIATIPANLVGIPALSLPCGTDAQGLPIGMQLMGPRLSEANLFAVAHQLEQAYGWHNRIAPAFSPVALP